MCITVYRWSDGPYLAFTDQDDRRYVLERDRASIVLARMRAHLPREPDRSLVIDRRFERDPKRDLIVLDMYLQDCDNYFEIVTATGPFLLATLAESGTLLLLAIEGTRTVATRRKLNISPVPLEFPLPVIWNASESLGMSYD